MTKLSLLGSSNRPRDRRHRRRTHHPPEPDRQFGDGLIAAQWRRSPSDPLLVRIVIDDVDSTFSPERATVSCPEGNCVPAQGTYVSHFSAPNCGGTESYYLPYDGYAYQCRTWNGTGACGTIQRTVTNYSARINNGPCQNLWPGGNTLTQFVTIYR